MDMFEVNHQFYWKPRVIWLLRKDFTNIKSFLDHPYFKDHYSDENSLRRLFKKIWKDEFTKIQSTYPSERNHFQILFRLLLKEHSKVFLRAEEIT